LHSAPIPPLLPQWQWFACYLTSGTHLAFYWSFVVVIILLFAGRAGIAAARLRRRAGAALALCAAALAGHGLHRDGARHAVIVFFLFVPIAVDQGVEYLMHHIRCPDWDEPVRRGSDFVVCAQAKVPLSSAAAWVHDIYAFTLALLAFALVFGAFAAQTLYGAMRAVPRAQVETAEAYGMTKGQAFRRVVLPQMWIFALPGLSNLWMILVKATPLLFLLGIQDIVYWARELGGSKTDLLHLPAPGLAAVVFPRGAGVLSAAHRGERARLQPADGPHEHRPGDGGRRAAAEGAGVRTCWESFDGLHFARHGRRVRRAAAAARHSTSHCATR
jgi:polar amino acid transport system permease protein